MNPIQEAWEQAKAGQIKEFKLGGFTFWPGADEFKVSKLKGGEITKDELKRLRLNIEKSTGRQWATMNTGMDGSSRFWIIPDAPNPLQGEPLARQAIASIKDNIRVAAVSCWRHNFRECVIPLDKTGKHYQWDCHYGTCAECGKTIMSLIK